MVVIISDLLTDLDAFYTAPRPACSTTGHEIIVFHVLDDDEIEMPFDDSVLFKDIEGDEELFAEPWAFRKAYKAAMEQFIAEVGERCRFAGIDHVLLKTSDELGGALAHYLHHRNQGDRGRRAGKLSERK